MASNRAVPVEVNLYFHVADKAEWEAIERVLLAQGPYVYDVIEMPDEWRPE